ncbi:RNA polymerase sigma-70 factor [Sphingobacterium phlebotomi]|uniref:RNA polymerase sigma-70 factor n=1 Tax=Sphingobacterium phlebotomi TaxID=2605433 RepID=A0A5D4H9T1_9SPHI|nr:RNA polymerase sigma-70 factor [Sphingobacterium phlebotomi]TYR36215.1 RNA polymerase sigma-70 factor [Sphingobacterium phlebotomi]
MITRKNISRETLLKLKSGDAKAFVEIYDAYHKGIFLFIHKYLRDDMSTEDIVHEVFMKIWEIKERIDPDKSFIAYMYRIARNATYKELKKRLEHASLDIFESEGTEPLATESLEESYQAKEYDLLLDHAVKSLPPQRQKVFVLCRQEGKTYEEVANQLCISPYTVKEHMSLAMKSIQDYMGKKAGLSISRTAFICALAMGML